MLYQFQGEMLPNVRLVDCCIICPPYVHFQRKAEEYIVYFIKRGEMFLRENGEEYVLQAGDFCILDPDYVHEGIKASWCEYYYIHFRQDSLRRMEETEEEWKLFAKIRQEAMESNPFSYGQCETVGVILPKVFHMANYQKRYQVMELLDEAIRKNQEHIEYYKIICGCKVNEALMEAGRSYVSQVLADSIGQASDTFLMVQEIEHYLNTEYGNTISGKGLEEKFGMNFDYMNRIFKRIAGTTIFRYLTQVRIQHARVLILYSGKRMAEIGELVGFKDEYYFSRVFKKSTGMSPTEFSRTEYPHLESLR